MARMADESPSHGASTARSLARIPRPGRLAAMALGVLAISTSSVLIRLADAPALAIGAWRLTLAFLVLSPLGAPALRREACRLTRREKLLLVLSAAALATHFGTWITSLAYTTVSSSVILVTTTPIYVAVASRLLWREKVSRRRAVAIVVAMAGSVLIGYGDLAMSGRALWGDLLAVMGALAMAAHLLMGRKLRRRLSTWAYVWPCYGLAGLILVIVCVARGYPLTGYSRDTWLVLLALAVVPQVVGHSVFNWALAYVSPLMVTLSILGEPIGASGLAWLVLRETPPVAAWVGGPLILAGIVMASREEAQHRAQARRAAPSTRDGSPARQPDTEPSEENST